MLKVGSKVKYLDTIGTVICFGFNCRVSIKVEKSLSYSIGNYIWFYEKDLKIIESIDPNSPYQYCIKCDILTSNKPSLCCVHKKKGINGIL